MPQKRLVGKNDAAIGYLRWSTGEQENSRIAQADAIASECGRRGATLVASFEDAGLSGRLPVSDRPGLLGAINALREHDAGLLVVARLDRVARDVVVSVLASRLVESAGGRIVSAAGEASDDSGPAGELMRTLLAAMAQYERAVISLRTSAALQARVERGLPVGRPSAADDADVVDRIRALANEHGPRANIIARELAREGVGREDRSGRLTRVQPRTVRAHLARLGLRRSQ